MKLTTQVLLGSRNGQYFMILKSIIINIVNLVSKYQGSDIMVIITPTFLLESPSHISEKCDEF